MILLFSTGFLWGKALSSANVLMNISVSRIFNTPSLLISWEFPLFAYEIEEFLYTMDPNMLYQSLVYLLVLLTFLLLLDSCYLMACTKYNHWWLSSHSMSSETYQTHHSHIEKYWIFGVFPEAYSTTRMTKAILAHLSVLRNINSKFHHCLNSSA